MPPLLSPQEKLRFNSEIIPHLDVLYRMARSVCSNGDLAEDISQEAFLKAVRGFPGLAPGTNSRSWLARIVQNTCRDYWRKHNRSLEDTWEGSELEALDTEETQIDWEPEVIHNAFPDDIEVVLRDLAPRWRAAVQLVDVEGWSYDEAAESLDMSPGSLRSALHRARKIIYQRLAQNNDGKLKQKKGTA